MRTRTWVHIESTKETCTSRIASKSLREYDHGVKPVPRDLDVVNMSLPQGIAASHIQSADVIASRLQPLRLRFARPTDAPRPGDAPRPRPRFPMRKRSGNIFALWRRGAMEAGIIPGASTKSGACEERTYDEKMRRLTRKGSEESCEGAEDNEFALGK